MRRPRTAGGLLLLVALAGGCMPRQDASRTAGFFDRVRGWAGQPAPAAFLDTRLVDQPAPDPYLTAGFWSAAAVNNPLTPEQSALLELNGLRVRVVSGVAPPRFLELLNSDGAAVNPMLRSAALGVAKVVPVNGPLPSARLAVRPDLKADEVPLDIQAAECGLAVTAKAVGAGTVTLWCEPQVQHGDRQAWLKPTADGTGFDRKEQKPQLAYPSLGFEVTVGPHDFLVVGATEDPAGTLGAAFFQVRSGDRLRQRVAVIRAGKADAGPPTGQPARTAAAAAAQTAVRPTVRGVAP